MEKQWKAAAGPGNQGVDNYGLSRICYWLHEEALCNAPARGSCTIFARASPFQVFATSTDWNSASTQRLEVVKTWELPPPVTETVQALKDWR